MALAIRVAPEGPIKCPVTISINGRSYRQDVEPRLLLVHFLRDAGLTGTKVGFCTPGMIFAAHEILRANPNPSVA